MKICNPMEEVPNNINLNDRDFLNIILEMEKNESDNLSIALNEASNDVLYDRLFEMFDEVKANAREAFRLMFCHGWYTLEEAEQTKINEALEKLNNKFNELDKED